MSLYNTKYNICFFTNKLIATSLIYCSLQSVKLYYKKTKHHIHHRLSIKSHIKKYHYYISIIFLSLHTIMQ